MNVEGMACGIPVVASRVGGIPEIAAEGGVILVEPDSAVELADALQKLVKDGDLRVKVAAQGLSSFRRRFTWPIIVKGYEGVEACAIPGAGGGGEVKMSDFTFETSDHRAIPLWKLVITWPLVLVLLKCAGAGFISTQDSSAGGFLTQAGNPGQRTGSKDLWICHRNYLACDTSPALSEDSNRIQSELSCYRYIWLGLGFHRLVSG